MAYTNVLADALKSINRAEKGGKLQVLIGPRSNVIIRLLTLVIQYRCIDELEITNDHRAGEILVDISGRLNKCGVISPRFDVQLRGLEIWKGNLLLSCQFICIVLTTSAYIMDYEEAT
ncbi:40S ribosomal protein S15a-like [Acomys russatus]|uniref:40S ribosomal protein S15a-like n=1 Tax=Acomys russatus TaxID=60746 RepID=UPI0021E32141|nr:40S ribosomal protein S15a-like [Acomys russatus]